MERWLGIDFSGDHSMWSPGCSRSNIWIAELSAGSGTATLTSLRRVQDLEGHGHPFNRLQAFLTRPDYEAAAIDAPFSVPAHRVPGGDHRALLSAAAQWDREGRVFATGTTLVEQLAPEKAPLGIKEYRQTERVWSVNARSTMWAGSRGGAAMTAACLTLLALIGRPIWPWSPATSNRLLAEAFPAAQLKAWHLPYQRYNGDDAVALSNRDLILEGMANRCHWSPTAAAVMLGCADALDALVCALAARAVTVGSLSRQPASGAEAEGCIAVQS